MTGANLNFGNLDPNTTQSRSRDPERLGRPAVQLALRRVGAARAASRHLDRRRLQPPPLGQFLRHLQRAGRARRLRRLFGAGPEPSEPAELRRHGIVRRDYAGGVGARVAQLHDEGRERRRRDAHGLLARRRRQRHGASGHGDAADGDRDRPRRTRHLRAVAGASAVAGQQRRRLLLGDGAVAHVGPRPGVVPRFPRSTCIASTTVRSIRTTASENASNGSSLAANYQIPNSVLVGFLGRLPAGATAAQNTTVNLLAPSELYPLERRTEVDVRVAKILRFGGSRLDVGVDLYNLFNSNTVTSYQQTYLYTNNGATWLRSDGDPRRRGWLGSTRRCRSSRAQADDHEGFGHEVHEERSPSSCFVARTFVVPWRLEKVTRMTDAGLPLWEEEASVEIAAESSLRVHLPGQHREHACQSRNRAGRGGWPSPGSTWFAWQNLPCRRREHRLGGCRSRARPTIGLRHCPAGRLPKI